MAKKVLLILDNSIISFDVTHMLEYGGYEVCGFSNNLSGAFTIFLNKSPDIIILDIASRPLQSALSFVKSIKGIRHCPIIYLVLEEDENFINEFIKPCLDAYIIKPISRYQLLLAANKLIALNKKFSKSAQ